MSHVYVPVSGGGGGGGALYRHHILGSNVVFDIIMSDPTPMTTKSQFAKWLYDNGYNSSSYTRTMYLGTAMDSTTYGIQDGLVVDNSNLINRHIYAFSTNGSTLSVQVYYEQVEFTAGKPSSVTAGANVFTFAFGSDTVYAL